jgi:hypothetical protein
MAIITQPPRIIPRLAPMSPYEVFLQQVKGAYDGIRAGRIDMTYYPSQFGGLFGQQQVLGEVVVLEVTDFEVHE